MRGAARVVLSKQCSRGCVGGYLVNFGAEAVLALHLCVGSAVSLVCHSKVLCSVSNTSN